MLAGLREFFKRLTNASAPVAPETARTTAVNYPEIPVPKPEDHPQFNRLEALYGIAADKSEWRDDEAELASARQIELFEDVWRQRVELFARTHENYLPVDPGQVVAAESPSWWIGAQLSAGSPAVRTQLPVLSEQMHQGWQRRRGGVG